MQEKSGRLAVAYCGTTCNRGRQKQAGVNPNIHFICKGCENKNRKCFACAYLEMENMIFQSVHKKTSDDILLIKASWEVKLSEEIKEIEERKENEKEKEKERGKPQKNSKKRKMRSFRKKEKKPKDPQKLKLEMAKRKAMSLEIEKIERLNAFKKREMELDTEEREYNLFERKERLKKKKEKRASQNPENRRALVPSEPTSISILPNPAKKRKSKAYVEPPAAKRQRVASPPAKMEEKEKEKEKEKEGGEMLEVASIEKEGSEKREMEEKDDEMVLTPTLMEEGRTPKAGKEEAEMSIFSKVPQLPILSNEKKEVSNSNHRLRPLFSVNHKPSSPFQASKKKKERPNILWNISKKGDARIFEIGKSKDRNGKVVVAGNSGNTNALITMANAPSFPKENFTAMNRKEKSPQQIEKELEARFEGSTNLQKTARWNQIIFAFEGSYAGVEDDKSLCIVDGTMHGENETWTELMIKVVLGGRKKEMRGWRYYNMLAFPGDGGVDSNYFYAMQNGKVAVNFQNATYVWVNGEGNTPKVSWKVKEMKMGKEMKSTYFRFSKGAKIRNAKAKEVTGIYTSPKRCLKLVVHFPHVPLRNANIPFTVSNKYGIAVKKGYISKGLFFFDDGKQLSIKIGGRKCIFIFENEVFARIC